MTRPGPQKVFLSYAHRDGAELAARLFDELANQGFAPWLDRDRLTPGDNWSRGIEQALDEADAVVAVLSPGVGESEICRAEHLRSLRKGKKVFPVLTDRTVDPPLYLEPTQWVCFGDGAFGERLDDLVQALGGPAGAALKADYKTTYQTIPPLPDSYVPREGDLTKLRDKLLAETVHRNIAVTAARGMGGAGKTVLAQALCRDDEMVQAAFPDGIVWLTVGERPEIVSVMREIPRALRASVEGWDSAPACSNQLKTLLKGKSVLLVLDDVWDVADLAPFKVDEPHSRILLTTRSGEVVSGSGANEHCIDELSRDEARDLLAKQAGVDLEELPPEAGELIAACGRLPLAIAMTGAMLRDGRNAWADVIEALRDADLEWVDQKLEHYSRYQSLFHALHASVERLPEDLRRSYVDLAVFEADAALPETALQALWGGTGRTVRTTARKLADLSLARQDDDRRLRLHDLQHDYVRNQALRRGDREIARLHGKLADGYKAQCAGAAWHEGPGDGYFFESLARHLKAAGREEELRGDLLLEPRWLEAKVKAAGAHALTLDYDEIPEDEDLRLVQGAVRLSSHVIEKDAEQLAPQMIGRLLSHESETLSAFRARCSEFRQGPWLEPLWPALDPPGTALLRTLSGHTSGVTAVALTADGRLAVSASSDQTLKVWDVERGREVRTLRGHTDLVRAVALTGDGRLAVSASDDKDLKVWDVESGRELRTLSGHTGYVSAVALTGDGRLAVSASDDKDLKVWDVESGRELRTLRGHDSYVSAVALTADGRLAVSASSDQTLKVWDVERGREVRTLRGHAAWVMAVALTGDGRLAVSASADKDLKVWDMESGRELRTLRGHAEWVRAVALTGDGRRAISASSDGTLKVWDVDSGREVRTLRGHGDGVMGVALTGEGRLAVSTSDDGTLKVWDVESGRELRTLRGHAEGVRAVALTEDGRRAVSGSDDDTLKVWDVDSGREVWTLRGHGDGVMGVALTGDGRLAVSASADKDLKVWDVESGRELRTLSGHTAWVMAVALTPDGRCAVSASLDKDLKVWDVESGRQLRTLRGHASRVSAVALTGNGRRAVSASSDRSVVVWDVESGEAVCRFVGDEVFRAVAVSGDGRLILAGDDGGRVHKLALRSR